MEIIRKISKIRAKQKNCILTIGTFDGVHLGHQAIIKDVVRRARSIKEKSVVLTFHPHPLEVFDSNSHSITTFGEKAGLIGELGVDVLVVLRFTKKLALLSPQQFIKKVLLRLVPKEIVVGSSHTFGKNGKGNAFFLKEAGSTHQFKVTVLHLRKYKGECVNSTGIRTLIRRGDMEKARAELGQYFSIAGKIVKGSGKGEMLGFPTANLKIPSSKILPENGVYAGYAWIAGKKYKGIVNVGCCPTFKKKIRHPRVEVFIMGFKNKLYGRLLKVEFMRKIRDEKKFNSPEALKLQIKKDILKV